MYLPLIRYRRPYVRPIQKRFGFFRISGKKFAETWETSEKKFDTQTKEIGLLTGEKLISNIYPKRRQIVVSLFGGSNGKSS